MNSQDYQKLDLPDTPGVYLFLKKGVFKNGILYVGKATSLKDRVKSYFGADLAATRGEHIVQMVAEADTVEYRSTDSVLEALMLEAELIRRLKPPYNTLGEDDKSFNHVILTKEPFPRVLLVRGHDLEEFAARWGAAESGEEVMLKTRPLAGGTIELSFKKTNRFGKLQVASNKLQAVYGPFPHAAQLREAMKIVRRIFPFRDKCVPCPEQRKPATFNLKPVTCLPCFNAQIGMCPGTCSGAMTQKEYARTIRHLKLFFEGKKHALVQMLEKEMREAAKKQEFEQAAILRGRIFALNHIQDVALIKENPSIGREKPYRIEAYDIAHMAGEHTVGVMVVVEDGVAQKSDYRKFKIHHQGVNDIAGLREVLTRRLKHDEWALPDLVAVDGSTAQKRAAEEALREHFADHPNPPIPVVGVVKNARHMPERLIGPTRIIARHERSILLANSEAHRFAITYHRSKRKVA